MGKQYSVYVPEGEEDLQEWVDNHAVEVFGSESAAFIKAMKFMKNEKGGQIESLSMSDGEDNTIL